ncbi:TIGR04157 family glycosyltransferase [uncultured Parabacteroides sp.]|nr:TIGR04157 family glycosyltransferase [uncultured Parabacteroides sp.]
MKKHIFLFNEGSRAAVYGIGTYIRQMVSCLTSTEEVSLHLVQLNSDVEKVTFSLQEGYEELSIPRCLFLLGDKSIRYYRSAWRLVQLYFPIAESESVFFLLNYSSHHTLIPQMRVAFPSCRIYFAIHYQDWCFSLNGNVSRFRELLQTQDIDTLDSAGKEVLTSYRKEKEIYEQADKVICLSRFTERLLWDEYRIARDKTVVIYNGLKDEADNCLSEVKKQLKEQFGFQPEEKIVLFVGRLDPIKGVRTLIRSFLSVLEKRKDCHLILVGDGDFSRYLKVCDGHWNKIIFTGRLEKERLYQFYRIADIGVLPSMHEQCSYTAIEMMMFGIPLITSTTTGLKEMVENESETLFDIESEDDENAISFLSALLNNVLSEISNGITYRQFVSREKYEKHYSIDRMKHELSCLLDDLSR